MMTIIHLRACFITEFGYLITLDCFENSNLIVLLLCGINSCFKKHLLFSNTEIWFIPASSTPVFIYPRKTFLWVLTHRKQTLSGTSRQNFLEIWKASWKEGFPPIFFTPMVFKECVWLLCEVLWFSSVACNFKSSSGQAGWLLQLVNTALLWHCSCNEIFSSSVLMLLYMRDGAVGQDGWNLNSMCLSHPKGMIDEFCPWWTSAFSLALCFRRFQEGTFSKYVAAS